MRNREHPVKMYEIGIEKMIKTVNIFVIYILENAFWTMSIEKTFLATILFFFIGPTWTSS